MISERVETVWMYRGGRDVVARADWMTFDSTF